MEPDALIGIDIGTTAVKAVLAHLSGRRIADHAVAYPTARPGPGVVEQDPADWLGAVQAALARFAATGARVRGIGITGQVNTHVFSDAGFAPLCPAIVWQDGRASAAGAALATSIAPAARIAALGADIPIDASHALSRMGWMAAERPDIWAATAHVMAPKDWVIARLTGTAGADPLASVGLVGTDLRYAAPVLDLVPRAAGLLPPLSDPLDVAGQVMDGPFAGVPVVRGTMDAWAAMFGTGVASEGQAMCLSGTSEVPALISATRKPAQGVIVFPPWRGINLHAAPTQAGGAALGWAARLAGMPVDAAAACIAGLRPGPHSPLFLPHLQGERAPLWDAQARGTFAGLSAADGPAEMIVAVMEGVAFATRLAFMALQQSGGIWPGVVRVGGGGTASDDWCQMRADAWRREVLRMAARDAGAVGAMVMAGTGAGLVPDLATAARSLVPEDRAFVPDAARADLADRRFAIWQQLYAQVRPINAALAEAG